MNVRTFVNIAHIVNTNDKTTWQVFAADHGLVLGADLEHAGFMPSIVHGIIRARRWPFSATALGSLSALGE
jgi:hypothetical protein